MNKHAARIRAPDAALMLGVSVQQLRIMAARGLIVSAAKIGSTWTFDPMRIAIRDDVPQENDELAPLLNIDDGRPKDRVYVVGFSHWIKIGWSSGVRGGRVRDLQTAIPVKLKIHAYISGGRNLEQRLHERFARYRRQGEWFVLKGELLSWVQRGCPFPDQFDRADYDG
jgi:hypothetical protein